APRTAAFTWRRIFRDDGQPCSAGKRVPTVWRVRPQVRRLRVRGSGPAGPPVPPGVAAVVPRGPGHAPGRADASGCTGQDADRRGRLGRVVFTRPPRGL